MNKLNIDKVLLARSFSAAVNNKTFLVEHLSVETAKKVKALFAQITESLSKQPIWNQTLTQ
jgi:hypothetical protein